MADFMHSTYTPQLRRRLLLVFGVAVLILGALFLAKFFIGGASNSATVLCSTGVCTANTLNTFLTATQGTVSFNTPATLNWHANNVENSVAGVNCFGNNEVTPCGTPYQTLFVGDDTKSKRSSYFTINNEVYVAMATNGDTSKMYKWMPATTTIGASGGLTGQYYNNKNLFSPVLVRKEGVNFNWVNASPDPAVIVDGFSIRWTGTLVAPVAGAYTFYTASDDGSRLYLDGALMTDDYTNHSYRTKTSVPITLAAGQKVAVEMDYFDNSGGAQVDLSWSYPGQVKQVIPTSALYPVYVHTGCLGDGYFCGYPNQVFETGADKGSGGFEPFVINGTPYLALGNSGNGTYSKIYKWLSAQSCFGSGSTCGAAFQDLGSGTDGAIGGLKAFSVGTDTFLALGSSGPSSLIYKWLSAQSCFGSGSTCGAAYQTVGGTVATGGWEPFVDSTDTYLALAINNNNSNDEDELYKWITNVASEASVKSKYFLGYSNTTMIDRSWTLDNGKTVTHIGMYSTTPQLVSVKIFNRTAANTYTLVYSSALQSHPGGGWADFAIPNTAITGTTFYAGVYGQSASIGFNNGSLPSSRITGNVVTNATISEFNGDSPHVRVRYTTSDGLSCAGDGFYCDYPLQTLYDSSADRAGRGGWEAFKINSETFLALGSDGDPSQLYKFMTSALPFDSSTTSEATRGGNRTIFDKSFRIVSPKTVTSIGTYSPTAQTVTVKIGKRISSTSYQLVRSQDCAVQAGVWTDCPLTVAFTPPDSAEYYVGLFAPSSSGGTPSNVPVAWAGANGIEGATQGGFSEVNDNAFEVRAIYSGAAAAITPCLGNGFVCGTPFQEFAFTQSAMFGWDAVKFGTDTYLGFGSVVDPSKVYRWMSTKRCFGDGTNCGTETQALDGGGTNLTPDGASLDFLPLDGKGYLLSSGYNNTTKLYKGTDIAAVYITVNPSLTASSTAVSWSAMNVTSCTVKDPANATFWGPTSGTSFATTSKMTITPPTASGQLYTIDCTTTSGAHITRTAATVVSDTFWGANSVTLDPVGNGWPMKDTGTCEVDVDCYLKQNSFVSNWGATALFGAHPRNIAVGTVVGQFGGHGPVASQGGGWEWTHYNPDSKRQFPSPPLKTLPSFSTSTPIVVNAGSTVDLEWTCMDNQSQNVPNTCSDPTGATCGNLYTQKNVDYSDSTVGTNFSTGGALKGKTSVTVSADTTYQVQCISHHTAGGMTYPAMSIPVYITGSPNIPPTPGTEPPKTTGCTVYSYDSVNGTSTVATGNDSPVGGFLTNNLLRNTTFTLSCTIEGGAVEESSIRVLIPPRVSAAVTQSAAEPATDGTLTLSIEDPLDYLLTVNYTLAPGSPYGAVLNTDYTALPSYTGTIDFPIGSTEVPITIHPLDDLIFEGNETMVLTVTAGSGYILGTPSAVTLTLTDDENNQSLPPGPTGGGGQLSTCTGVLASATCNLAAKPGLVRKGGISTISWYVDKNVTGANGNFGDTCAITASPSTDWGTPPTFSVAGPNNVWSDQRDLTVNINTTLTLRCVSPNSSVSTSTSLTVKLVPTFQER